MAECVCFESTFQRSSTDREIPIAQGGNDWGAVEKWTPGEHGMVQEITIRNRDDFESDYYVELDAFFINMENKEYKIINGPVTKMSSHNIRFVIQEHEYSFLDQVGGKYKFRVQLTPVFQFLNIQSPKEPKKRTKIDLLEGLKQLSQDMGKILEEDVSPDVTLCFGDETFKAHSNILSARSTLFRDLFEEVAKNSNRAEISFAGLRVQIDSDVDSWDQKTKPHFKITVNDDKKIPSDVNNFIDFIYTGKTKVLTFREAEDLLPIAHHYGVSDMQKKCTSTLKLGINEETRLKLYLLAFDYKCPDLQGYVADHVVKVMKSNLMDKPEKDLWKDIFVESDRPSLERVQKVEERRRRQRAMIFDYRDQQ